ncbi:hypothetical protein C2S52_019582 [Perilla frutescens var. hirtella]|nr:hypothetical protein C2S52_019582 [Perilla frutescens var. hirtella]KAH6806162.1 hypothetical protein C2S51_030993 [Perilla frutescens var. frutescens]
MGKKMKFPSLFKATDSTTTTTTTSAAASPWPWPACVNNPKTLSFRANANTNIYKTMNSAYLDDKATAEFAETPDSFFSIRRGEESFSSASEIHEESAVIGGLRSDRLFFEPGETSSILEEAKAQAFPYSESVKIMAMDSNDPFLDFRESMAEMVEAHGLKSWECLEELLTCYLRVNGKSNHGYIVGAFVDMLIHIALTSASAIDEHCSSSSTTTQYSFTSPLSFSSSSTYSSTSPCLSLPENEDEIAVEKSASSCSQGA